MTIREIAKIAGVSPSTVSKVLHGNDASISEETIERVKRLVLKYNYLPYNTVRKCTMIKSNLVAILVKNLVDSADLISGIMDELQMAGYNLIVYSQDCPEFREQEFVDVLTRNSIDALIIDSEVAVTRNTEETLKKVGIIVHRFSFSKEDNLSSINYEALGHFLTSTLIGYHHRKIACVFQPELGNRSEQYINGFKRALLESSIPFNPEMLISSANNSIFSYLYTHQFSAVVCESVYSAYDIYLQYSMRTYSIPSDISIVSLCSEYNFNKALHEISSVYTQESAFGKAVGKCIISYLERGEEIEGIHFLPDLSFNNKKSIGIAPSHRFKRIIVVGSINTDISLNVNSLPTSGQIHVAKASNTSPGGKGLNQAIGVARLGREVSLIAKLGNDYESTIIVDSLRDEKVCLKGIFHESRAVTGKAYIYVPDNTESSITLLSGANMYLSPADIREKEMLFEDCGYCLISTEIPLSAVFSAVQVSKEKGVKTILKPSALQSLDRAMLSEIDYFVPNKKEACDLCSSVDDVEKQADIFLSYGVANVIITLGHDGCFLKNKTTSKYYPAVDIASIDSTGGADAFISAFASYLSIGYTLDAAIRIGMYAAAFCVSKEGVVSALINKSALENYISQKEPLLLSM